MCIPVEVQRQSLDSAMNKRLLSSWHGILGILNSEWSCIYLSPIVRPSSYVLAVECYCPGEFNSVGELCISQPWSAALPRAVWSGMAGCT